MKTSRLRAACQALAALIFSSAAIVQAQGETRLFRDFQYDTPIAQFGDKTGFYDCSKDLGYTARCADDSKFLDHTFETQILSFINDRLRSVELVAPAKPEVYASLMKVLGESFALIMLQSGDKRMDLIELHKKQNATNFKARLAEFESAGLNREEITYVFLERPLEELRKFANVVEAIEKSPATMREADITIAKVEGSAYIGVSFSLPRRALADMQNAPVKREKF